MPNFCTKVMQHVLKQKYEISSDLIVQIMLGKDLCHIFLMDSKCIASLIIYHEKYHFLLELFSCIAIWLHTSPHLILILVTSPLQ